MAKANNKNLSSAKREKNDEFYTPLTYIEKELKHYREFLRDKIVFCNCDDPEASNFWNYFASNFEFLGLKKLISTHYETDKPSYKLELSSDVDGDGKITGLDRVQTSLSQNGDFRSPECIELLKECDVVITNPPFSLFREYLTQLVDYDKKFLIIGSLNAITYKTTMPLLMNNKAWLGVNSGAFEFIIPDGTTQKFGNICWFTNMRIENPPEPKKFTMPYTPEKYPKYDNYDVINVNRVIDIPGNYEGVMGVPITYALIWKPTEFEVLGIANNVRWIGYECLTFLQGEPLYNRLLIKRRISCSE